MTFGRVRSLALALVIAGSGGMGCSTTTAGASQDAATAGSGDAVGSGGDPGTGGILGSGGGTSSGGTSGSGGATGSGGTLGSGGAGSGGAGAGGRDMTGDGGAAAGGKSGTGNGGASATGGRAGGDGGAGAGGSTTYTPCPAPGTACKVLPFGDSITFGVGSNGSDSNGGYRVELFHRAHADGKQVTFVGTATPNGPTTVDGAMFPRQHEGHSGNTIDNVPASATLTSRSGISPLVAMVMQSTKPDVVTLMIGTNDIQHDIDVANAPTRLGKLIDSIIAASDRTLIVIAQIVPTTDATLNPAIETFNTAIATLVSTRAAAGKHVLLIDLYHAMTNDPAFKTSGRTVADSNAGLMYDWLHPNVAGYKVLGDAWYEALKPVLR